MYTGNGSATFDPSITLSKASSVILQTSDGQNTATTGTSHAFSYTPASGGPYRCTARVAVGLVTAIDADADALTSIKNCNMFRGCYRITVHNNSSLVFPLSLTPPNATYMAFSNNPVPIGKMVAEQTGKLFFIRDPHDPWFYV